MTLRHQTLTFEREYDATPARLFAAFADPRARERWAVPSGARLVYDVDDFRIGGIDLCRCGSPDDLRYHVENRYLEIEPGQRIVVSETVREGGRVLSHALNAVEISDGPIGAILKLTIQMAAVEPGMLDGARHGHAATLDNLAAELARPESPLPRNEQTFETLAEK
ncbi:MAG: SRPBCC domain-containing protein [Brevundimonas sp.]